MRQKVIFFDIDGTLLSADGTIPESTINGIQKLKENGHLSFICTGRTLPMIPKELTKIGFDGVIAGGGTYIAVKEKVIYYRELTEEEFRLSYELLMNGKVEFLYEGRYGLYMKQPELYRDIKFIREHLKKMDAPCEVIAGQTFIHTSKISCVVTKESWDYCMQIGERLKDMFHMIIHQMPAKQEERRAMTDGFVEFLPKGITKATAVEKVLQYMQIKRKDSYAFGDSNNDIEMLDYVGCAVAMKNSSKRAIEIADYVTEDIMENGIYNGLKHYELI